MALLGVEAAIAALTEAQNQFIAKFAINVRKIAEHVHRGILDRHPVWSGESISAWHWTVDGSGGGGGSSIEKKSYTKAESEQFGHTGSMPLGSEPMRASATANVENEFSSMQISPDDPFHIYIMSNDNPRTEMLEYGEIPRTSRSRNPGGMIRITEAEIQSMIGLMI